MIFYYELTEEGFINMFDISKELHLRSYVCENMMMKDMMQVDTCIVTLFYDIERS